MIEILGCYKHPNPCAVCEDCLAEWRAQMKEELVMAFSLETK